MLRLVLERELDAARAASPEDQKTLTECAEKLETARIEERNVTVEAAAAAFAALSARVTDAPMVHVIDRGGRHAGIFHGAGFGRINLVLYINGLTNAPPPEPGLLDRLFGAFQ